MVVTLGQQYDTGEKPPLLCCTFTLIAMQRHPPDKNKTKTFLVHHKNRFIIIYSNDIVIGPYTLDLRAYSREQKQCYNIVVSHIF